MERVILPYEEPFVINRAKCVLVRDVLRMDERHHGLKTLERRAHVLLLRIGICERIECRETLHEAPHHRRI
jgi:hypothetical protein